MVAMHQRKPWLWGPLSLLGLSLAVTTIVLDQVHKWWMLGVFDIQTMICHSVTGLPGQNFGGLSRQPAVTWSLESCSM